MHFLKVLNRGQSDEYYQIVTDVVALVEDLEQVTPVGEYYHIKSTLGTVALNKATLKTGPRTKTREYELVEVEADGVVVGSAESLV